MAKAYFPMKYLRITQGYGVNYNGVKADTYSHEGSYALDLGGADTGTDYLYAPFDCVVKRVYGAYNSVWFESKDVIDSVGSKVIMQCLHMNDADKTSLGIAVGKEFNQGEPCYREGTAGNVTGAHIHMEVGKAPFTGTGWHKNEFDVWEINDKLIPNEIFVLPSDCVVLNDYGYNWQYDGIASDKLNCIDVAKYQYSIDWDKVKASGKADVAIIRAGYRGYVSGAVVADEYSEANIKGAINAGIEHIGLYFFSQAITEKEAIEEAQYCISLTKKWNIPCDAGIWYDSEWSNVDHDGRADGLSKANRTKLAKAFCDECIANGYTTGIYASTSWYGEHLDMSLLPYPLWVADYRGYMGYKGDNDIFGWQYSSTAKIDGIDANVDVSEWYQEFNKIVPLSNEPVRMTCYATGGDNKQICAKLSAIGINYKNIDNEIITSDSISAGDQLALIKFANTIGVEWNIYKEPTIEEMIVNEPIVDDVDYELKIAQIENEYDIKISQMSNDYNELLDNYNKALSEVVNCRAKLNILQTRIGNAIVALKGEE